MFKCVNEKYSFISKKKVISRYLTKDIGVDEVKNIQNNKVKSTDINILLNRVREDKKKE